MEKGKQIVENEEEDNNGNGPNGGGGSSDSDFDPTDAELLELYSKNEILEKHIRNDRIRDVNIYDYHPEQLFEEYKLDREKEGYFYTPRKRKSFYGSQPARAAGNGFWKASGNTSIKPILSNNTTVGYTRRLLYKEGKPKTVEKNTSWRMLEYTLDQPQNDSATAALAVTASDMKLDDCLCKIYDRNHLKRGGGTSAENSRNSQQEEEEDDQNHEILPINADDYSYDSDEVLLFADQAAALPYGSHDNDYVDVPNSLPQPQPLEQHNSDFGEPMQDMECAAVLDAHLKSFERKNH